MNIFRLSFLLWGAIALFCSIVLSHLLSPIITENLVFDGIGWNGAFQMYNPLRRLDAGQIPGKDFVFFHGIGTLLLHRPVFLLLGGTLMASEVSTYVTSLVCIFLSVFVFLRGTGLKNVSAILVTLLCTTCMLGMHLEDIVYPNHNTLGVRTFFPLFSIGVILWMTRAGWFTARPAWQQSCLCSIFFGVASVGAFTMATEHGLALALASFVTLLFCNPVAKRWWHKVLAPVVFFGTVTGGTLLLFFLLSPSGWRELLHFALVDIPQDQFWYFGAPPHLIVENAFSFFLLGRNTMASNLLLQACVILITCIAGYIVFRKDTPKRTFFSLLIGLQLYGLITTISSLGYFSIFYFFNLEKVTFLVCTALIIFWVQQKNPLSLLYHWIDSSAKNPTFRNPDVQKLIGWWIAPHVVAGVLLVLLMISPYLYFFDADRVSWSVFLAYSVIVLSLITVYFWQKKHHQKPAIPRLFPLYALLVVCIIATPWRSLPPTPTMDQWHFFRTYSQQPWASVPLSIDWGVSTKALQEVVGPMEHAEFETPRSVWNHFLDSGHAHRPVRFFLPASSVPEEAAPSSWVSFPSGSIAQVMSQQTTGDRAILQVRTLRDAMPGKTPIPLDIDFKHQPLTNQDLWAQYANFWFAGYDIFQPASDYIIHSLGDEKRAQYVQTFEATKPRYALLLRGTTPWSGWLTASHWDFMRSVIKNYRPVLQTHTYTLWERDDEPNTPPKEPPLARSFDMPQDFDGTWNIPDEVLAAHPDAEEVILEMTLHSTAHNPWQKLPLLGKINRHWITAENVIGLKTFSLPPHKDTVTIPLHFRPEKPPVLHARVVQPLGFPSDWNIHKITYQWLDIDRVDLEGLKH